MIERAKPFFKELAAKNHFKADFTDDADTINDENLKRYQVFVMLHLAPFDMTAPQQEALQKFVESGKGWVGIHAAGLTGKEFLAPDTKYWQWFEEFMGSVLYSPHPAYQKGAVIIEDRHHPTTKHLPAKFEISDEWYEFNASPRGRVRVLATADESSYKQNKPMGDLRLSGRTNAIGERYTSPSVTTHLPLKTETIALYCAILSCGRLPNDTHRFPHPLFRSFHSECVWHGDLQPYETEIPRPRPLRERRASYRILKESQSLAR